MDNESTTLYQLALDNIPKIEKEFNIVMDKEMFESEKLPQYFNIHIDNINDVYDGYFGVIYNFEVFEGSAQILCKYLPISEEIVVICWNDILENHLLNNQLKKH